MSRRYWLYNSVHLVKYLSGTATSKAGSFHTSIEIGQSQDLDIFNMYTSNDKSSTIAISDELKALRSTAKVSRAKRMFTSYSVCTRLKFLQFVINFTQDRS